MLDEQAPTLTEYEHDSIGSGRIQMWTTWLSQVAAIDTIIASLTRLPNKLIWRNWILVEEMAFFALSAGTIS